MGAPDSPDRRGGGNSKGTRRGFGSVRKLSSGRYQARYTGPDGLEYRAPTTFALKGDATKWLALQSASITEAKWKPPSAKAAAVPFGEYAEKWLASRELKPRTRAEYRRILATLVDDFGAETQLRTITPERVRTWHEQKGNGRPSARAHAYALLGSILRTAEEDGLIDTNPCRIRGGSTAKTVHRVEPATPAEIDAIAAAMPGRYAAMVLVAAWCQLRFGELTELRRRDVDMNHEVIHVTRAVTWAEGVAVVGTPKSDAGVRSVAIPPHILPRIAAHLDDYAQPGPDGLLFPAVESGGHMKHGALYKVFRRARRLAGREDLRWHDLRHTGATLAAQAGATTRELMNRLGHTTAGVAMRYQHVAAGRDAEIARRLSKLAGGAE